MRHAPVSIIRLGSTYIYIAKHRVAINGRLLKLPWEAQESSSRLSFGGRHQIGLARFPARFGVIVAIRPTQGFSIGWRRPGPMVFALCNRLPIIWPIPSVATKSWPGRVEILSAYLGSFGAGGVWPVIVCAGEKPPCHAGGRSRFTPPLQPSARPRRYEPKSGLIPS
jgi:hypothetical protein